MIKLLSFKFDYQLQLFFAIRGCISHMERYFSKLTLTPGKLPVIALAPDTAYLDYRHGVCY